jgi:hypothetical protein
MLRTQTIQGNRAKVVWLSKTSDDANLNKLTLRNKGKPTDADPQLVGVERGTQVYITQFSTKRCKGRDVFIKVQVRDGPNKGLEGWICGSTTTHHKVILPL